MDSRVTKEALRNPELFSLIISRLLRYYDNGDCSKFFV